MLLPDERRELQVAFRSPQAGIFTEDWQVDTWPRVPTGTLQLSFCGIAVSRDTHAGDRAELQSGLEQQAMAQALRQLVLDVADSASLQGMAAVPRVPSMLTDADRFLLLNTSIAAYYNQRIVCSLADLHARAFCALHAPEKSSAPPSAAKKKPAPTPAGKKGATSRVQARMGIVQAEAGEMLSSGMGIFATVGSISAFVGLFGTVWGIMNSFIGIAQSQTTNLAVVAPGIAEALFATAIGLFAAIPAVIFYNMFARRIGAYSTRMENFASEILVKIAREE